MNNHIGDANKKVAAAQIDGPTEVEWMMACNEIVGAGEAEEIITRAFSIAEIPRSTPAAPGIDPADPWRGLYAPELMPKLDGVGVWSAIHPDLPQWPNPEDEERALDPLVKAQGFAFAVVDGEYPDEDHVADEPDACAWLANWKPEPPAGEHCRLVMVHDTEDGPAAVYVRPLALIDTKPKIDTFDLVAHLQRQREWSELTFGPGTRAAGIVDHIRKELLEIEADPGDLREWIDVAILALDGAWRAGAAPVQIVDALVAKQTKNEGRVWPDWRTMSADRAIEHDRSADSPKGDVPRSDLVPGVVRCAKCSFQLARTNLYLGSGTTGPGDSKTEPCPNGCGPLWPVTWETWATEGWQQAERYHEELRLLQDSPKGGSNAPDMFWNDADPERAFDSITELVSREWSNGAVVAGDVMEIQQATRLPNIKVRVVDSEDDGVDYENMQATSAEVGA